MKSLRLLSVAALAVSFLCFEVSADDETSCDVLIEQRVGAESGPAIGAQDSPLGGATAFESKRNLNVLFPIIAVLVTVLAGPFVRRAFKT
ncbi:MAG: hypothetical protein ABMA13_15945 [Chthoniobacteraceae bacterium]